MHNTAVAYLSPWKDNNLLISLFLLALPFREGHCAATQKWTHLVGCAELYGLVLAPRLKKGYHQIWEANLQPKNAQNWPQVFLALTPSGKRALVFIILTNVI